MHTRSIGRLTATLLTATFATLSACQPQEPLPPAKAPPAPTATPAASAPEPELPAEGVIDERKTLGGALARVEHKDGLRILSLDGVVQAAVPIAKIHEIPSGDPLATLVRAARPPRADGKTPVLVLGLGSGRTARQLAAAGYDVAVVEKDAAVIELARKYFAFDGKVTEAEATSALEAVDFESTIVIVDSWVGVRMPKPAYDLLVPKAKKALLVALRDSGAPFEDRIQKGYRALVRGPFAERLGSGVADEPQNLYFFVSGKRGFNFVPPAVDGLGLWRIPESAEDMPSRVEQTRSIRLTGYLVRSKEDGRLALDLPHHEMGAARYLLAGDTAALEKLLPAGATFPTDGDIESDGDASGTLRDVLGGGGVKRSDVRFSPVLVDLQGVARLVAVVNPNSAASVPAAERGDAPTHPSLPYGGALYELSIEKVVRAVDKSAWDTLQKTLDKAWKKAIAAAKKGKMLDAGTAIKSYVLGMDDLFGDARPRTLRGRYLAALYETVIVQYLESEATVPATHGGAVGAACHESWRVQVSPEPYPSVQPLRDAFLECADTFLTRAILTGPVDFRMELGNRMTDVLRNRYEGEKLLRKWKTMSSWVSPPG